MKKTYFLSFLLALAFGLNAFSQPGQLGLVGTINGWAAPDHKLTRDLSDPFRFTTIITIDAADTNAGGIVEVKFRVNEDWAVNYGGAAFPAGTGTVNGVNIDSIDPGTYFVEVIISADEATADYTFTETCGSIGLVGTLTGWGGNPDIALTRSAVNPNDWSGVANLDSTGTGPIQVKFRENSDWATNWGGPTFPAGVGVQDGPNLDSIEPGTYQIAFNCESGAYEFTSTCGEIGIVGTLTGWGGSPDIALSRSASDPNVWSGVANLDSTGTGAIQIKFRENASWTVNWGGPTFPAGVGVQDGPNLDSIEPGYYFATFNCETGEYNFEATTGPIGIVGAFSDWGNQPDVPMNRDAVDPNVWSVTRSWRSAS